MGCDEFGVAGYDAFIDGRQRRIHRVLDVMCPSETRDVPYSSTDDSLIQPFQPSSEV